MLLASEVWGLHQLLNEIRNSESVTTVIETEISRAVHDQMASIEAFVVSFCQLVNSYQELALRHTDQTEAVEALSVELNTLIAKITVLQAVYLETMSTDGDNITQMLVELDTTRQRMGELIAQQTERAKRAEAERDENAEEITYLKTKLEAAISEIQEQRIRARQAETRTTVLAEARTNAKREAAALQKRIVQLEAEIARLSETLTRREEVKVKDEDQQTPKEPIIPAQR